jgi:hypothetical protein
MSLAGPDMEYLKYCWGVEELLRGSLKVDTELSMLIKSQQRSGPCFRLGSQSHTSAQ